MWRTFDVGAVVDALPFEAATAAGAGGMARQVARASLAATPDHLKRVGANELVVTTTATLLATGETPDRLVARMDAAHVAGVAVRLDPTEPLPGALVEAADQLAFPVITFPGEAALADVTAAVLDALLDAQRRRLERVLDIHQRFTRIVLAGGGLPQIASTLHELLGCPVAVLDADGRPTVVVPSDAAVAFDRADEVVRQAIRAGDEEYGEIVAGIEPGAID